jgi:hypothetical protein
MITAWLRLRHWYRTHRTAGRLTELIAALAVGAAAVLPSMAAATPAAATPAATGPFTWSSAVNVERPPYSEPTSVAALSCLASQVCVGFDAEGGVLTSADPAGGAGAWHVTPHVVQSVTGVPALSCVKASPVLCAGVDEGKPITSTSPSGGVGSWHSRTVPIALQSISCTSKTFCLGAGAGGFEFSTNPTGGTSAWHAVKIGKSRAIYRATCVSRSFCAAVDISSGDVLTTTNPTGSAAAWKVTDLSSVATMTQISCPTRSRCYAADSIGDVLTSVNPRGGAGAWHRFPAGFVLQRLTCPSVTECLGESGGQLVTSTSPAAGASGWHLASVAWLQSGGTAYDPLACASASLCVGGNGSGDIATSARPGGGASTWQAPVNVTGSNGISAVACPSAALCVAGDSHGNVLTSTDPGAGKWKLADIDGEPSFAANAGITALACPSTSECVATDPRGDVLSSTSPAGGASAWHSALVDTGEFPAGGVQGLQCPAAELCVGYDGESGNLVASTSPAGGASAWVTTALPVAHSFVLTSLDCPVATLCVAGDSAGEVLASTNPAGGASAWHVVQPEGSSGQDITGMACTGDTTRAVCAATDTSGQLVTSADPKGPASAWQVVTLPNTQRLNALACPSLTLCLATGYVNEEPAVWYTTDPSGGAATWHERGTSVASTPAGSFTCLNAKLCIGPWSSGAQTGVITSTTPTARNGWTVTRLRPLAPGNHIAVVGCAFTQLCVAGDSHGDLFTGRTG